MKKESAPSASLMKWPTCKKCKTAFFITLLFASMVFFGIMCRFIIMHTVEILIGGPLLGIAIVGMIISTIVLIIVTGAIAMLIRPIWLGIEAMLAASAIFMLCIGFSMTTLVMGILLFLFLCIFVLSTLQKENNEIIWSIHPLVDAQKISIFIFVVMLSASFGIGYADSMKRSHRIIPSEIATLGIDFVASQAQNTAKNSTPMRSQEFELKSGVLYESLTKTVQDIEKSLQPVGRYVPLAVALAVFAVLQSFFIITHFFVLFLSALFFALLTKMQVVTVLIKTREVKHIVLD